MFIVLGEGSNKWLWMCVIVCVGICLCCLEKLFYFLLCRVGFCGEGGKFLSEGFFNREEVFFKDVELGWWVKFRRGFRGYGGGFIYYVVDIGSFLGFGDFNIVCVRIVIWYFRV